MTLPSFGRWRRLESSQYEAPLGPGVVETTLAEVLTARGRALRLPLGPDNTRPVIIISACEDASIGAEVHLRGSLADCMRAEQTAALPCSPQHPHS